MKTLNKNLLINTLLVLFLFTLTSNAIGQETIKYEYAEVIVLQKIAKGRSDVKEMYLNSTTDNNLDSADIKALNDSSSMYKFMNNNNWEFVDRFSLQSGNTAPAWVNYTFRKRIN